jgi:hypothetical protein
MLEITLRPQQENVKEEEREKKQRKWEVKG